MNYNLRKKKCHEPLFFKIERKFNKVMKKFGPENTTGKMGRQRKVPDTFSLIYIAFWKAGSIM